MENSNFLKISLLVTRIFVAWMMALWALQRISSAGPPGFVTTYYDVGGIQFSAIPQGLIGYILLVLYILMVIGFKKKITYLLVFAVHLLGTLVVIKFSLPFIDGFRTTWFTSWPALMAMWLLWVLRDQDTLLSLKGKWG